MGVVELAIVQPPHGAVLTNPATQLQGQVVSAPPGVTLHYRWYSSLFAATQTRISINDAALPDPATPYATTLNFGRNVLTLAASDKQLEADLPNTEHGGVTGGATPPAPRVVTVLSAAILAPAAGATLSRAGATLDAEAPARAEDEDHAEVDRLRYRWRFTPQPADGRAAGSIAGPPLSGDQPPATFATLVFMPGAGATGRMARYAGPLPSALGNGAYQLTLRVESADAPAQGMEVSRQVVIAP